MVLLQVDLRSEDSSLCIVRWKNFSTYDVYDLHIVGPHDWEVFVGDVEPGDLNVYQWTSDEERPNADEKTEWETRQAHRFLLTFSLGGERWTRRGMLPVRLAPDVDDVD